MISPTPKFKTREFKDALTELKAIFDAHSLGIVLLDALERQPAEQIYARMGRNPGGGRLANLKKTEIIGQVTAGFFSVDDVAFQILKEMDRSCHKERHIVASIPEDQAPDRIGSYRAIALKRERAKLVWALARDDRPAVRGLANRIIKEFFAEAADFEVAKAIVEGTEDSAALKDVELAKRLKEQAERLAEAAERVTDLESKVHKYEDERARLLVAMGQRERQLKEESEARGELEGQINGLRRQLQAVDAEHDEAAAARQSEAEARAMAEDLAQKVRRLSKLASASEALEEREAALTSAQRRIDELTRTLERDAASAAAREVEKEREHQRLRGELEATRDELKAARRQLVRLEALVPAGSEAPRPAGPERVVVLLDQANLAATASITHRRKVNFSALLDRLTAGRSLVRAVAFVVDNGGVAFDAFCDTLKKSGWELRIKRPKQFADGSSKADWDMGIAMEAITLRDQADTLVLASGDGDFAPLLKQLRRWGQRVEVAAYAEGLALELVNAADAVTRLDTGTLE